jgi:hypothetical protein
VEPSHGSPTAWTARQCPSVPWRYCIGSRSLGHPRPNNVSQCGPFCWCRPSPSNARLPSSSRWSTTRYDMVRAGCHNSLLAARLDHWAGGCRCSSRPRRAAAASSGWSDADASLRQATWSVNRGCDLVLQLRAAAQWGPAGAQSPSLLHSFRRQSTAVVHGVCADCVGEHACQSQGELHSEPYSLASAHHISICVMCAIHVCLNAGPGMPGMPPPPPSNGVPGMPPGMRPPGIIPPGRCRALCVCVCVCV